MPLYTAPDCLPYFSCDDSPCVNTGDVCNPSTVWCDLANLLDARLADFDNVINRTAAAVPFFKIARTVPQIIDTNVINYTNQIQFDAVLADNDGLIDLTSLNTQARIGRTGLWWFQLYLYGTPPATNGNVFYGGINNGSPGGFYTQMAAQYRGNNVYIRADYATEITQFQLDLAGQVSIGATADYTGTTGTGLVVVNYAELTGYWYGEEVP
jgi:hypothetical protein